MRCPPRVTPLGLAAALLNLCGLSCTRGPEHPKMAVAGEPAWIDAFSGWASPTTGQLFARVHRGKPQPKPVPGQIDFERLKQTIDALELDALPGATVSVQGVPGV